MPALRFTKTDPDRGERRWYVIAWGPTLFDTWAVVRAWGRLGTNWEQHRVEEFPTADLACERAQAQVQRRLRRGYMRTE